MSSNPPKDERSTSSRFAPHLDTLGTEQRVGLDQNKPADKTKPSGSIDMPPVDVAKTGALPVSRRRKLWYFGALAGFAASAAFVLLPHDSKRANHPDDGIPGKGDGPATAEVFVSKSGDVSLYDAKAVYESGTRFRVLVHATEPTLAYATVAVKGDQVLAEGAELVQSKVAVGAGEDQFFPGSLELTGANDRESLIVMLCPKAAVENMAPDGLRIGLLALAKGESVAGTIRACKRQVFSLRR